MKQHATEPTEHPFVPKDEYDIDFDFDFRFGLAEYCLMLLFLVVALPIELAGRITTGCYRTYQARKANESMGTLVLE